MPVIINIVISITSLFLSPEIASKRIYSIKAYLIRASTWLEHLSPGILEYWNILLEYCLLEF